MHSATELASAIAAGPDDGAALYAWERSLRRNWWVHQRSSEVSHRLVASRWGPRLLRAATRDSTVIGDAGLMLFDHGRLRASTGLRIASQWLHRN